MFEASIVRPYVIAAPAMNTLESLAADQASMPYPPVCPILAGAASRSGLGPTMRLGSPEGIETALAAPAAGGAITPTHARRAGKEQHRRAAESRHHSADAAARQPAAHDCPNTLQAVAAALQCQVYSFVLDPGVPTDPPRIYIGLYQDNLTAPNVVAPGLTIQIGGIEYTTNEQSTLLDIQNAFAPLELSTGDFVVELETVDGIFRATAMLTHADFIVPQPPPPTGPAPASPVFSLADMPSGTGGIEYLARTNRIVANFYNAGAPVYLSYQCYTPQASDTFSSLSQTWSVTVGQLGEYNKASGRSRLSSRFRIWSGCRMQRRDRPYAPTAQDSLNSIATLFGSTAAAVAGINRYLPGIYEPGVSITLNVTSNPYPGVTLQTDKTISRSRWIRCSPSPPSSRWISRCSSRRRRAWPVSTGATARSLRACPPCPVQAARVSRSTA